MTQRDRVDRTRDQMIGNRLKLLRGDKTMQQVADALGVTRNTICAYEQGKRRPSDEDKIRLARYYGVSVSDIFFADEYAKRGH